MTLKMFFFHVVLKQFLCLELVAESVNAQVHKQKAWVRSPVMSRRKFPKFLEGKLFAKEALIPYLV